MNEFEKLGLNDKLVAAITKMGYETPTPIQALVIPHVLENPGDVVALAQTGTGKTAAFGLPLLQMLKPGNHGVQALILSPTRELCVQIAENMQSFLPKGENINIVAVYGGTSITNQIRDIKRGADVIVATPGRLMDLIERKKVELGNVSIAVLDEADEMLNMGFRDDIEHILGFTPEEKFVWLFSATFSSDIRKIANKYMRQPTELAASQSNSVNENIDHSYMVVEERHRFEALKRIVDFTPDIFGLIFCRTKLDTQEVAERMMKEGYVADSLHGDLSQQQRDRVMAKFRNRTLNMLVATDVAARGIDVDDITHVIHYNMPDDIEYYTHRSGRTGRQGKKGTSILIASPRDLGRVTSLERMLKTRFTKIPVPSGIEVCEQQLLLQIEKVVNVEVQEEQIAPYWSKVYASLEGFDKEEIIKKFASVEFNRFLEYYKDAPDLNRKERDRDRDRSRSGSDSRDTFSRRSDSGQRSERGDRGDRGERREKGEALYFNIGKNDRFDIGKMVGLLCNKGQIENRFLGKIELKDEYCLVEVDPKYTHQLLERFSNLKVNGKQIHAKLTEEGIQTQNTPAKKHRKFSEVRSGKPDFKKKFKKPASRY